MFALKLCALLVSRVAVLFQLINEAHLELMSHKQILMRSFIEMIPMRFDDTSLVMIIVLGEIIKRILQSNCITYKYKIK